MAARNRATYLDGRLADTPTLELLHDPGCVGGRADGLDEDDDGLGAVDDLESLAKVPLVPPEVNHAIIVIARTVAVYPLADAKGGDAETDNDAGHGVGGGADPFRLRNVVADREALSERDEGDEEDGRVERVKQAGEGIGELVHGHPHGRGNTVEAEGDGHDYAVADQVADGVPDCIDFNVRLVISRTYAMPYHPDSDDGQAAGQHSTYSAQSGIAPFSHRTPSRAGSPRDLAARRVRAQVVKMKGIGTARMTTIPMIEYMCFVIGRLLIVEM